MVERRYACPCGWAGTTPLPVEDVLGERLLWTAYLCPQCWQEVGEDPEPPESHNIHSGKDGGHDDH
jgi:hypothetical protein